MNLEVLLQIAGAVQIGIAVLNLFLVRILRWQLELAGLPLLLREVFQVHLWFISVTVGLFGVLTVRFAGEIAGGANDLARWLAAGIGIFWGLRTILQITYYSATHWRGIAPRTAIHMALLVMYGGMAVVYLKGAGV